jgi:hypothetical protein
MRVWVDLILEKWVLSCLSLLILSYHSFANGWQECFIKLPHTCQTGCMVHKLSCMENMGLFNYGLSCVFKHDSCSL